MTEQGSKLDALYEREWQWQLKEWPTLATYAGDPRFDALWNDEREEAIESRKEHEVDVLGEIRSFARESLAADEQLNYDLFLRNLESAVEGHRFPSELMPVSQMGGPHQDIPDVLQSQPRRNESDLRKVIERLRRVPALVEQTIALMRRGATAGVVHPRVVLRDMTRLLGESVVEDPTTSAIYEVAFAELPNSIPNDVQKRIQTEGLAAIHESVTPAFAALRAFFDQTYLPASRESIALSNLPDGDAWYQYQIAQHTTTSMTADEIHELGLSEVERIRSQMEAIRKATGFTGTLNEFFSFLRDDSRFFFDDADSLVVAYRDICKKIDPGLSRLFKTLPRLPYGVLPVPAYSQETQTTAYYYPGAPDAGRPGYFFANTFDLKSRPKWEMEALSLHEAVPGHHLQIALAQELTSVPNFRRFVNYTAFVEGWALYAESLGEDLGLYTDPYSKFGQLTYEMWRSIRLVVDTGMHARGWSRDQAIRFFRENAGKTDHDIVVEVDRYIVWPGQALAYKVGELKIRELRRRAESALGSGFDIRRFHDAVLEAGPLPLSMLEARIGSWIERERQGGAFAGLSLAERGQ
ncbi:MAG: DUF885 domain-containing protein [Acidobacteriota bacterium]